MHRIVHAVHTPSCESRESTSSTSPLRKSEATHQLPFTHTDQSSESFPDNWWVRKPGISRSRGPSAMARADRIRTSVGRLHALDRVACVQCLQALAADAYDHHCTVLRFDTRTRGWRGFFLGTHRNWDDRLSGWRFEFSRGAMRIDVGRQEMSEELEPPSASY